MGEQIEKIEVLNERDFDRLIDEHEIERFMCSGDKCVESDNILRLVFYSDFDLFDELAEQLIDSDMGFRLYGISKDRVHCTVIEVVTPKHIF